MRRRLLSILTLALLAAPALAAEAEGGAGSPFAGDLGNALWTLAIFVVVVLVLGKFAWGPLLSGLQARETFIRQALEDAQRNRDEAEARLKEYADKLNAARAEGMALVEEARRDAEAVKRRLLEEAQAEGKRERERARHEIELATDTAKKELFALGAKLVTAAAAKVLQREISSTDHERLIAEAIRELESKAN